MGDHAHQGYRGMDALRAERERRRLRDAGGKSPEEVLHDAETEKAPSLTSEVERRRQSTLAFAAEIGFGAVVGEVVLGGNIVFTFSSGAQLTCALPADAVLEDPYK